MYRQVRIHCGNLFSGAMAKATKLLLNRALLHLSVLSLRPDGSYVRLWLRGWSVLSAMVSAGRNGSVVSVCFCWCKGACCRNRWSCAAGWVGPCLCKVATGGGRQRTGLWVYGWYGVFVMCWSKLSSLSILSQASEQNRVEHCIHGLTPQQQQVVIFFLLQQYKVC